ncbi:hypothetical protein D3C85_1183330 [compost metagenome]
MGIGQLLELGIDQMLQLHHLLAVCLQIGGQHGLALELRLQFGLFAGLLAQRRQGVGDHIVIDGAAQQGAADQDEDPLGDLGPTRHVVEIQFIELL